MQDKPRNVYFDSRDSTTHVKYQACSRDIAHSHQKALMGLDPITRPLAIKTTSLKGSEAVAQLLT